LTSLRRQINTFLKDSNTNLQMFYAFKAKMKSKKMNCSAVFAKKLKKAGKPLKKG
jgi:hypothetical protein